ncbi:hypothetical protein [Aliikangiella maris]|uniref:DUF945 domain-containing protein n=2 Tax=Aliikangiella maris TaxID=3162458 RepID=A0ABV3MU14_9GAMM
MLRFLIKFLLLVIVLGAITLLTAQWKLEKDIRSFADVISPYADFRYESARIGMSGEVKISSISLYIDSLSSTVEIGEIIFQAGNLFDLAFFESDIRQNKLPQKAHIFISNVLIPFTPALMNVFESDANPTTIDILDAAYCGDIDHLGMNEFEAMGYDYLAFSSKDFYMLDKYSGSAILNGHAEIEEFLNISYQINIAGVLNWVQSVQDNALGVTSEVVAPRLSLFDLRIKDAGFFEKKAQYCAKQQQVTVDEYYQGHVNKVSELFSEAGMTLSDSLKSGYTHLIKPQSTFHWFLQPEEEFNWHKIADYKLDEVIDKTGLKVSVNNQPVEEFVENWSSQKFANIAEIELLKLAQKDPEKSSRYNIITVTYSFQPVSVRQAGQYIDYRAKLLRDDNTLYEGRLNKVSAKTIWISVREKSGEVIIPVDRVRVKRLEVYKKDPEPQIQ